MTSNAAPLLPESPEGMKRHSARLIVWGGGAAVIVMFVLISMLTPTPMPANSNSDAKEEQEISRLKQQKNNAQKNWFDNRVIPDVTAPASKHLVETNHETDDLNSEPIPAQVSSPSEYDLKVQEERQKAQLEMERFRQRIPLTRLQQLEDGVRSPLRIISPSKSTGKMNSLAQIAPSAHNPTSNARITDFGGSQFPFGDLIDPSQESYNAQNGQNAKDAFLTEPDRKNLTDHYVLDSLHAPLSPYEVKAGSVIPAALITGINSDLPGAVIAQVREHVYDTVSGNFLLIPQGAKLIGRYDSQISFGQDRALVVWNRMIMPDGKSIDLGAMQGVDIAGYAGFNDRVNNHYLRIYGNALLMSLVGGGYELLANPNQNNNNINDPQSVIAANVGLQLAQLTNQITRRNINIQPTIEISQGYRFNVMVMKDLILQPR